MLNRKPKIKYQKKICIICEGYEEYEYFNKILHLNIWDENYKFNLVNAESNGKIPARYNDAYVNDSYDIVLAFCDTDKKPFEDYNTIKRKIDNTHGVKNSSENVIIFANPCTMQIILLHFEKVHLTSHKKNDNRSLIKNLTGVSNYDAKKDQRRRICDLINIRNYKTMILNCKDLPTDDEIVGSSNFYQFAQNFSSANDEWINDINKILETN